MRKVDIRSKCRVNSNCEKDTFVGLRCSDGDISINFPIGYHISEDDNEREFDTLKSKKVPQSLEIGLFFCQIFIFII